MSSFKVLSTKKLRTALAAQVKESGIDLFEKEFVHIEPSVSNDASNKINNLLSKHSFVVFTSSNAVEAIANLAYAAKWKIFCLAGKTREAVTKNLQASEVIDTADNATELAKAIISHEIREIVFFCGNQRRDELPSILKSNGINADEVTVYRTTEAPWTVSQALDAVLFFSPSAVRSFFSSNQLPASAVCFAIGNTTAEEIKLFSKNKIIAADAPSQDALVAKLINYYKQPVQS